MSSDELKATLEAVALPQSCVVDLTPRTVYNGRGGAWSALKVEMPRRLRFRCDKCGGERSFEWLGCQQAIKDIWAHEPELIVWDDFHGFYVAVYRCVDCENTCKVLSLAVARKSLEIHSLRFVADLFKIGEWPTTLPPLPESLMRMAGQAKQLLIQGYECELQQKGIGALSYYRRVLIIRYKNLLESILKVAEDSQCSVEIIDRIKDSISKSQLKRSLEISSDILPPSLMAGGSNPLLIIHEHFSSDMHHATDQDCLISASTFREALALLTDRIDWAKRDSHQFKELVTKANRKPQLSSQSKRGSEDVEAADTKELADTGENHPE